MRWLSLAEWILIFAMRSSRLRWWKSPVSGALGGLDIKVPEGIEIQDQTAGIFGGTDVRDVGDPAPGAPMLVIKGVSLFGGVSIKGPKKRR